LPDASVEIQPEADADGILPLSPAQLGLWFLWRAQPDNAAYNIPVALRLRGELSVEALRAAFMQAAVRHPALRTRLVERGTRLPGQRIEDPRPIELRVIDFSNDPAPVARANRLTDEDALAPFNLLESAPLWRVRLLRIADDDHVLSLVVHHIISDGQSIDLWLDEIRSTYVALKSGAPVTHPVPLAPVLPVSAPRSRVVFWRDALQTLDTAASNILPAPPSGRAMQPRWTASRIAFEFDEALIRRARAMSVEAHATLPMLLHAALNVVLYRVTGTSDQPIGVLASTREQSGDAARHALGLFINAVVVRTQLAERDTPTTILDAVRDAALSAYAHADTPFAEVVAALRAPREGMTNPLFQVMFNYLRPAANAGQDWAGLSLEAFNDVRHRVVFELELDIVEHRDGRVTGAFSYANELVDATFANALAGDYLVAVNQFVDTPNTILGPVYPRFKTTTSAPMPITLDAEAASTARTLERLWRDLFNGQTLSHDDNLFEAGASSFDVVRFIDATRAAGFALNIRDVFETPSIAGLALRIASNVELREP
jgi:aryl carrier-like protein